MIYRIKFAPHSRRALDKIDKPQRRRVLARIQQLASDPRPPGVRMLKGRHADLYIRVGDYRVIYTIDDAVLLVLVIDIGHRRDIYR